jgi:hypothetical protein
MRRLTSRVSLPPGTATLAASNFLAQMTALAQASRAVPGSANCQ